MVLGVCMAGGTGVCDGVCMVGGACVIGVHTWQGVCGRGIHGKGGVWQGACM